MAAERRAGRALFWSLLALHLAALWALPAFISQDGPIHLEIATVLRKLWAGDAAFARFFAINPKPEPNWLIYLPLAGLLAAFKPAVAEKVLLSGYLLALPLAARYALRRVRPQAAWLAVLAFPFLRSYPLHMGFYNFCFALAAFFLAVGLHAARVPRLDRKATAGLALAFVLVAAAHPVALLAALLLTGCRGVAELLAERSAAKSATPPGWLALLRRHLVPLALAALPGLLVVLAFLGEEGARDYQRMAFAVLLRHLGALYSIVSFSKRELWISVPLAALLGLLALWRAVAVARRRWTPADGYGVAAAVLVLVYFAAPVGLAGGGYLNQRLLLFVAFALLLWLAADAALDRLATPLLVVVAGLAVAQLGLHVQSQLRLDADLGEYMAVVPQLEPGRTLLSASFAHRGTAGRGGSLRIEPFQHVAGRLVAERGIVDLNDYQADRGYFPIVYRPQCNPYRVLGTIDDLEGEPPSVDLSRYPAAGCGEVDYVLLWDLAAEARERPATRALLDQLAAGYERVATSPRQLAELYRRKR